MSTGKVCGSRGFQQICRQLCKGWFKSLLVSCCCHIPTYFIIYIYSYTHLKNLCLTQDFNHSCRNAYTNSTINHLLKKYSRAYDRTIKTTNCKGAGYYNLSICHTYPSGAKPTSGNYILQMIGILVYCFLKFVQSKFYRLFTQIQYILSQILENGMADFCQTIQQF